MSERHRIPNSELPPIVVIATTWAPEGPVGDSRLASFHEALLSWSDNLHYEGDLYLHVADDGSRKNSHGNADPIDLAGDMAIGRGYGPWEEYSTTEQDRKGVGASLNAGLAAAFDRTPLALYVVDDWELTEELDLTPWARLLLVEESIGAVRLGPPHPGIHGEIQMFDDGFALRLNPAFGGFVASQRPTLYHKRFHEVHGWWPEGVSAYECERIFNEAFCQRQERLNNAILAGQFDEKGATIAYALPVAWKHIGITEVGDITPS